MSGTQYAGSNPGLGHNRGPMMVDASMLGFTDAEQRVWSFFVQQASLIEANIFKTLYPGIRYPDLIPVDTSGGEWLQAVTYFSTDRVGQAQWFTAQAQDVPLVGLTKSVFATSVQMAAIGYGYNEEELAVAAQLNQNLTTDKADACRRAAEEFIDRVALFGDTSMGFSGLTNTASVTVQPLTADGTGSSALWANKTPDQILRDININLTTIWSGTNTIEMADTVLLPLNQYTDILTRRLDTLGSMSVMDYLMKSNVYTAETGRPLTIRALYGLNNAGAGSVSRIVVYRRSPDVLKLRMPMPYQFRAPWRKGPLTYEVPGIFRLGGLDVRRPGAMRYLDGA